jgi:hypothetical protein
MVGGDLAVDERETHQEPVTAETPDVIGTVRAYRSWDLTPSGMLDAKTYSYPWKPGVNEATCDRDIPVFTSEPPFVLHFNRPRHQVPGEECSCGFYACTDPHSPALYRAGVSGVVEMSGGIVEHELNTVIRAGKARITALCMPRDRFSEKETDQVRAQYPGVPVFRDRTAMLRKFPPAGAAAQARRSQLKRRLKWSWPFAALEFGVGGWNLFLFFWRGDWYDLAAGIVFTGLGALFCTHDGGPYGAVKSLARRLA